MTDFFNPAKHGLSHWIAGSLVMAVLAATLVLVALVERFARQSVALDAQSALSQIAWQMRDQLDRQMAYRYEELSILASLDELQDGQNPLKIRKVLDEVQQAFPHYAWLGYAKADGTVLAANQSLLEGKNVGARPWFKGALNGPFVGDVHPAVLLAKLLPQQTEPWRFVDIAVPVLDANGAVSKVLGAHLSWAWARDLRRDLLAPALQRYQVDVFIVDKAGKVLLGTAGSEGKPIGLPTQLAGADTRSGTQADPLQTWSNGVSYATAMLPTQGHGRYPGLGWVVVVRQPEAVAMADLILLRRQLIAGGIVTCLLAMLCAPLVARRLTGPLGQLTDAIEHRTDQAQTPIPRLRQYREVALLSNALADLTERERQRAELELRESKNYLHAVADNIPALMAHVDRDLCYRFANEAYRSWFGVDPAQLIGAHMSTLYPPESIKSWQVHLDQVWQGERVEFERTRQIGTQTRYEHVTYLPHFEEDGSVGGFYALISDNTAQKELELRLQNEAAHDPLTGLPNRRHLMGQLPQALARADRARQPLGLLFLDLNGFKGVNDTHGHDAGDELLRQVALRLQAAVRKGDTVVRLAGDEFVVLLEPMKGGQLDAEVVARKIDDTIEQPFELEAATVQISVSTGIALHEPGSGGRADDLLATADAAMYQAKKARKALA